jgi:hypothetical protein
MARCCNNGTKMFQAAGLAGKIASFPVHDSNCPEMPLCHNSVSYGMYSPAKPNFAVF